MRIGFDSRPAKWYRGTGIGTYSYQLLNWFNKINDENEYVIFLPEDCDFDIRFKKKFQLEYIQRKGSDNFWEEVNVPNTIKDKRIDLYHVPQNGVGLPKEKEFPFLITLHDVIPYRMPQTCSDRYLNIFNNEIPKIVENCDGIITVSQFSKKDIIRAFNIPEDKIYVTHLAAEDIYRPLQKSKSKMLVKKLYGISGDFILYIGGFSPRKNIIGLIEAFSKLLEIYKKEIFLVIAGTKGKSYEIYKQRTIDLNVENNVIFPGFIDMSHMPLIYNAAKLFVYPSFYEGFGLPPIEAMACGTPVITSNLTSIPEIVGNSALLMDPYDVDELSDKMYYALTDKSIRKALTARGLQRSKALSWENTAIKTLNAYKDIFNNI
ncbi:MAG: glycosyltransferase family 4 protein [Clostridiaceae bacterium]